MKRTLSVFVLALAMVALVGCKKKTTPTDGVSVPAVPESTVEAGKTAVKDASAEAKKTAAELPAKPKDHPAH